MDRTGKIRDIAIAEKQNHRRLSREGGEHVMPAKAPALIWHRLREQHPERLFQLTCMALFVPSELIEIGLERSLNMPKKRPTPEQIVTLLGR